MTFSFTYTTMQFCFFISPYFIITYSIIVYLEVKGYKLRYTSMQICVHINSYGRKYMDIVLIGISLYWTPLTGRSTCFGRTHLVGTNIFMCVTELLVWMFPLKDDRSYQSEDKCIQTNKIWFSVVQYTIFTLMRTSPLMITPLFRDSPFRNLHLISWFSLPHNFQFESAP